jgi:hypothetical protein
MEYLPFVSIGISLLGLIATYVKLSNDGEQRSRLQSERIAKIETKVDLFWRVVETNVGQLLKSPDHYLKDLLIDKMARRELTLPEAEQLRSILTDEMQLMGRQNGVVAYTLILGRIEQLLYDLRAKKKC